MRPSVQPAEEEGLKHVIKVRPKYENNYVMFIYLFLPVNSTVFKT
jgi:hypothetical protein